MSKKVEAMDFHGISEGAVFAGMAEWDKAHKEGVRHWPEMLARVYKVMRDMESQPTGVDGRS